MRIYIAAHSQDKAKALKECLEAFGHQVVSRWIISDTKFGQGVAAYSDAERRSLAVMDEEDVRACEALVLIAEAEGRMVPGGKHVETGIAMALRRPIFVVGRRENLFHWHPSVTVLTNENELPTALQSCLATSDIDS